MIRVLIADDSPTTRALLREVLEAEEDIQVVGEACDGLEAVKMADSLHPNVITMDVQMPHLNGFQATKEIMIRNPVPTLILTGRFDVSEQAFTRNTFRSGAVSALAQLPGADDEDFRAAAEALRSAIREMAATQVCRHWRYAPLVANRNSGRGADDVQAIVLLTSSHGAPATRDLLRRLPTELPVPILVVAHLGPSFLPGFAAWLDRETPFTVRLAEDGEAPAPGTVLIAPAERHMQIRVDGEDAFIQLSDAPAVRGVRPSAAVLCESAAEAYAHTAVAVFLKGNPRDSLLGLCGIRLAGGCVLALENRSHCVGMDLAAGLADAVLPLQKIACQLEEVCAPREPKADAEKSDEEALDVPGWSGEGMRLSLA